MDYFDKADKLYEEAKEDYQEGEYKLAIEKLDKAIELNDVEAMYFYERGHAKDELEDYKGAELQESNIEFISFDPTII